MSKKSRGTQAERDLIHKFWGKRWACMRAAGSGSSQFPSPDVIVGNGSRQLAIEVKLTRSERVYFKEKEIRSLDYFGKKFGAEPWVGVKFFRKPWYFLPLEDVESSGKHFKVTLKNAELTGFTFEELLNF